MEGKRSMFNLNAFSSNALKKLPVSIVAELKSNSLGKERAATPPTL